jgi:hypothetical protein
MKTFLTLAVSLCAAALAGCNGTAPTINPTDIATAIADGCLVVQPTLAATSTLQSANAPLGAATVVNGAFCSANEAVAAKAVAAVATSAPAAATPASAASASSAQ